MRLRTSRRLRNATTGIRRRRMLQEIDKLMAQHYDPDAADLLYGDIIDPYGEVLLNAHHQGLAIPAELAFRMEMFDELPQVIRWRLHENITVLTEEPFVRFLQGKNTPLERNRAVHEALVAIAEEEWRNQRMFSAIHKLRYGYPLPHIAARATIQRYGKR
jgi:hypothetical protein